MKELKYRFNLSYLGTVYGKKVRVIHEYFHNGIKMVGVEYLEEPKDYVNNTYLPACFVRLI